MKYLFVGLLFCMPLAAQPLDDERAWKAYTAGYYEEAFSAIESCIAHDSTNYRYFFLKGKILENLYRYNEAIETQQRALRLNPESLETKSALASLYHFSGQSPAAVLLYEQLATEEPSVARWKMNLARVLQSMGIFGDAVSVLKTVLQTDSTNWLVYKTIGDCYRKDSSEMSAEYYRKSLYCYPQNKTLYGQLTRLYVTLDRMDDAIATGMEAVAADSTNADAWKHMGTAWYKMGIPKKAYYTLRKALALGDTSIITASYYGMLRLHSANYEDAAKYLGKALDADPNNLNYMYHLAVSYGYIGKADEGLELLNQIDKVVASYDSTGTQSNILRGYLCRILERYDEAAKIFIGVTKKKPDEFKNFYEVAQCYDMASKRKQALDWYVRFLNKIDPEWNTKQWTDKDRQKLTLQNIAMDRVAALKTD